MFMLRERKVTPFGASWGIKGGQRFKVMQRRSFVGGGGGGGGTGMLLQAALQTIKALASIIRQQQP